MMLTEQIIKKINTYTKEFKNWRNGEQGEEWNIERNRKLELHNYLLSRENLKHFTEADFSELIKNLWASGYFTNKDYLVKKVLNDNGIEKIKSSLENLLYGAESIESRFDAFKIKGLGPSSTTEILSFGSPDDFCIWNTRARNTFKYLGFDSIKGMDDILEIYHITGKQYSLLNQTMKLIQQELNKLGVSCANLLDVDLFIYYVAITKIEGKEVLPGEELISEKNENYDFDHDEIIAKLVELGIGLGFDVEEGTEVAKGAKLDVIWRTKIANLGSVAYAFEVHRRGSRDSAILNLQRAKRDSSVQKLIIVSNDGELKIFKSEINNLPEDFKKSVEYLGAKEVLHAADHFEKLKVFVLDKLQGEVKTV